MWGERKVGFYGQLFEPLPTNHDLMWSAGELDAGVCP